MMMVWGEKILYECVACVCFAFSTIFLVIAFFMALGFLKGVMILSFALPIDLNKSRWNSENGQCTKVTEILVWLPWPSREQSTFFISSNSKLLFSACSNLCANTDPLVGVNLVFWKELNKCFLYFFLRSLCFAMLGILSTPLFCWLKWTALCKLSKSCPLLTTILPLKQYLKKVYRQSTCW